MNVGFFLFVCLFFFCLFMLNMCSLACDSERVHAIIFPYSRHVVALAYMCTIT